jgi:hypothetical protein
VELGAGYICVCDFQGALLTWCPSNNLLLVSQLLNRPAHQM